MMNKKTILSLCVACALSVSVPAYAKVEATVNGVEITSEQLEALKKDSVTKLGQALPEKDLLDTLIRTEVVKQAAESSGIDKEPALLDKMKDFKLQLVLSEYMRKLSEDMKVADKEYKTAYDAFLKTFSKEQYKASHILLKEKSEAEEVIKLLGKEGADFAALAKEKSIGPSNTSGGSLGWFEPAAMVKPFSDATAKLKKGEFTKTPVKTKFGYHVILLEETKETVPPKLEELKPELKRQLLPIKLLERVEEMTAKAKVVRTPAK